MIFQKRELFTRALTSLLRDICNLLNGKEVENYD